jgi:hypothetical protein
MKAGMRRFGLARIYQFWNFSPKGVDFSGTAC